MTGKKRSGNSVWEFFQQLGRTFMLPVALLSFCGIMLGIGSSLSSRDVITLLPLLGHPLPQAIFIWMSKIGAFAFTFLPVMFCIAIPLGLAREDKGVAAFVPSHRNRVQSAFFHEAICQKTLAQAGGTIQQQSVGQTSAHFLIDRSIADHIADLQQFPLDGSVPDHLVK